MCESEIEKAKEEQLLVLIKAAHDSERSRILNIILQKREKLNLENEVELCVYQELTDIINKIQG